MTVIELKYTIEKIEAQFKNDTETDARSVSNMRKELFDNFKRTIFANNQERQENWNQLQVLLDALKEKQLVLDKENEKFALEAESKIEQVRLAVENCDVQQKESLEVVKKMVTETAEFIKQQNWPGRERRTAGWENFKNCRELLKAKEDAFYNRLREEKNKQAEQSGAITQAVLYAIRACHPDAAADKLLDIAATIAALSNTTATDAAVAETVQSSPGNEENKKQTPLKTKSEGLRDLRKFVLDNRDTITREDKQRIFAAIDEVQEELDKAWAVYKEDLQKKKDEWAERQKQREQKHAEWELKQKDFLAKLEDRLAKQNAYKEKLAAVYEKQNVFWERLEKRIISQQDYILQLQQQLNELEDKYAVTTDSKYREKLSEWIKGKYSRIEEVEADIKDMEAKIADAKKNIEDLPGRMDEVDKSREEIQQKIEEVKQNLQASH